MKFKLAYLSLFMAIAVSGCPANAPDSGMRGDNIGIPLADLAGDISRQVIIDRDPAQYLGHPSTLLLKDGISMLIAYPKGHGKGPIVLRRSDDAGAHWSEPLPVPASFATSLETPTLFRLAGPDGKERIILFSGLYPIRSARSEDNGATWTELEPIGDFGGIVAMSSMVKLRDGRYMALFHDDGRFIHGRGLPGPFKVYKTISADGGLTWSEPEIVVTHPLAQLCEPGAVRSPDGALLAVFLRENSRKFNSMVIFSDDEGETWTKPRELPASLTGDRHVAAYAPDGRLFVTFRDMARGSMTWGDWIGWVGTFGDLEAGREGQYRIRLMRNTYKGDCGYAGLELLPDGSFFTASYGHWSEGEPPYIVGVSFRLEETDVLAR